MKKLLLVLVLAASILPGMAQSRTKPSVSREEVDEMLQQSKRKRTGAIIMASSGGVMLFGGLIMMAAGVFSNYDSYYDTYDTNDGLIIAGAATSLAGIGVGVGSIGLFVKSHRLRKAAQHARVTMNTQMVPYSPAAGRITRMPQAGFTLSIPLGR